MNKWILIILLFSVTSCGTVGIKNIEQKKHNLVEIQTLMAVELVKQKNYRGALEAVDKGIKVDASYPYAWMVKGIIYQNMKANTEADGVFRKALSLAPNSAEINNNYGWFLCDSQNDYINSFERFNRALKDLAYPTPELAYMNLGICAGRSGQFDLAEKNLQLALNISPNFSYPIVELSRVKYLRGQYQSAYELFKNYQSRVSPLRPEDLELGYIIASKVGALADQTAYINSLKTLYPYAEETLRLQR